MVRLPSNHFALFCQSILNLQCKILGTVHTRIVRNDKEIAYVENDLSNPLRITRIPDQNANNDWSIFQGN